MPTDIIDQRKTQEKAALKMFIERNLKADSTLSLAEQVSALIPEALKQNIITPSLYRPGKGSFVKQLNDRGHRTEGGYTPEELYRYESNGEHVTVFAFGWQNGAVTPIHTHPLVTPHGSINKVYKCGLVIAEGSIKETTYDQDGKELSKTDLNKGDTTVDIYNSHAGQSPQFHRLKVRKETTEEVVTIHTYPLAWNARRCDQLQSKGAGIGG